MYKLIQQLYWWVMHNTPTLQMLVASITHIAG